MLELIEAWDGESVSIHHDAKTGTFMFICVHSTRLGPSGGGTRMKHYPLLIDALIDGMRLSEAMTLKFACVEFPRGGGKSVIALPEPGQPRGEARRRLLHEFGAFVRSLGGIYSCAPDMNTSAEDMDVIAQVCPFVFCRTEAAGGSGDTAPDTAVGVFHGLRAACKHVFGTDDLSARSVFVQGAGGVGRPLIEMLARAGAAVTAADPDPDRLAGLREEGIAIAPPEEALTTTCDVLAPCATGGLLNEKTIPGLRCRVVAGAANNQLGQPSDAERLRRRGITYAPDFMINAGGVLHGGGLEEQGWSRKTLDARLAGIGDAILEIMDAADREGIDTDTAARRIARNRLDAGG